MVEEEREGNEETVAEGAESAAETEEVAAEAAAVEAGVKPTE